MYATKIYMLYKRITIITRIKSYIFDVIHDTNINI